MSRITKNILTIKFIHTDSGIRILEYCQNNEISVSANCKPTWSGWMFGLFTARNNKYNKLLSWLAILFFWCRN